MEGGDLGLLLELQEIDARQAALEQELARLEAAEELEELRRRVKAGEDHLHAHRETLARLGREVGWSEKEVAELKRKQAELERKLYSGEVASAKELDQMRKKIELMRQNMSDLDDRALRTMEELDQLGPLIQRLKDELDAQRRALAEAEQAHARRLAEVREALAALPARRQELAASLEPALLAEYDRIRARRGGLAAVRLSRGICGGCRVAVPPVLVAQARQGRPVKCESCGRLLCWGD